MAYVVKVIALPDARALGDVRAEQSLLQRLAGTGMRAPLPWQLVWMRAHAGLVMTCAHPCLLPRPHKSYIRARRSECASTPCLVMTCALLACKSVC